MFSPEEFIEKLTALIPPPRSHLVRWAGVFAPNSPFRQEITLKPQIKKGFQFAAAKGDQRVVNKAWSRMLASVFKIDVSRCDKCGGDMLAVCAVLERESIVRYLSSLGIDVDPPARAPPKIRQEEFDFDQASNHDHDEITIELA